ncbi:FRG domain-containing protein [Nitrosococcus oceani]|uniref:FRG domain-containing protein n=1 Tax=Nitrosococcus oceani TaxID=1229 RepID=UPI0004E89E66|nr:FRG domain-containing protein [Nitrosococcus oceani]KFI22552.1 hypothetical protein HW44_08965 [Nitrosococcus oceani]
MGQSPYPQLLPKELPIVSSWQALTKLYGDNPKWSEDRWIFRGQSDCSWGLQPSLEREAERFKVPFDKRQQLEDELLREFKRHYHRYSVSPPQDNDDMEWLSIMQHYGVPTRLLDWTYSFWVSVYFAIKKHNFSLCQCSALWAFDVQWWAKQAFEKHGRLKELIKCDKNAKNPETVREILKINKPFIYPLNPFRLDKRLAFQQGVFLVPGTVEKKFMENLSELASEEEGEKHFIKIPISLDLKNYLEAFNELRKMNISRETLFPGLDGFAGQVKESSVAYFVYREAKGVSDNTNPPNDIG